MPSSTPMRHHLTITPGVMGGAVCINGTRIGPETLAALVNERGLTCDDVAALYPDIRPSAVALACWYWERLDGNDRLAHVWKREYDRMTAQESRTAGVAKVLARKEQER